MTVPIRYAVAADVERLAQVWHDGYHEAHSRIVPADLTRHRTLESLRQRIHAALPEVRVAGPVGAPLGFCLVKGDELYQLYVDGVARGTGVAAALVADAEMRMAEAGVAVAWLACAIGNERAARFYEKCGWRRAGVLTYEPETAGETFRLEVWRYKKRLG